jgi:hypothetical protein
VLELKQLQSWNEFSNSSQFSVPVVLSATRECTQFLSAMKTLLHISGDNARRAPFTGSSAAGVVGSYPQLVLCSYNTVLSQSMHTLSLMNVGCRSFFTVETTTSGSSEGEHSNISRSISLTFVQGETLVLWLQLYPGHSTKMCWIERLNTWGRVSDRR